VQRDKWERQDFLDLLETLVIREALGLLVLPETWDSQVIREQVELKDHKEILDQWVNKVSKALLDQLDHKVTLETLDLLVRWVMLADQVPREETVSPEAVEILVKMAVSA